MMLKWPIRKIKVDIITLILSLVALSSLTLIFYTYRRNYNNVFDISKQTAREVNSGVIQKINSVISQTELTIQLSKKTITTTNLSIDSQELKSYFIQLLELEPYLSSINVVTLQGEYLSFLNADMAHIRTYFYSKEPLPMGVKYVARSIDKEGAEVYYYFDSEGSFTEERSKKAKYDPLKEAWVEKTIRWPHLRWSQVHLNPWNEPVVTVATPLWNANELFGVMWMNLSLNELSNFLSHIQVGKTGEIFMFSGGEIVLPMMKVLEKKEGSVPLDVVAKSYQIYNKHKEKEFTVDSQGKSYFVEYTIFPLNYETKWLLATIIPFNDFFSEIDKTQREILLMSLLILIIYGIFVYFASKHISDPIVALSEEINQIEKFDFQEKKPIGSYIYEIISLKNSIAAMRKAIQAFSLYVPKDIVRIFFNKGEEIKLGGERKELTVMFTDIENFTTFSEALTIDQLTSSLGAYFDVISHVIVAHEGTIDKYVGDAILAFWGAPQAIQDPVDKACLAALRSYKKYEQELKTNPKLPPWQTRMGIHTGEVFVGNIGTPERMNYTVLGNVVNTAARLQSKNKDYKTKIIISESVHEKIGARYVTRPLDYVAVKGKKNKITLYELVASKMESDLYPSEEEERLCTLFSEAYFLFHEGKLSKAKEAFEQIRREFPNDFPTQMYLERL